MIFRGEYSDDGVTPQFINLNELSWKVIDLIQKMHGFMPFLLSLFV